MLRIHSYLLSLPSLTVTSGAPSHPLLPLQPLSLHEYVNVAMLEIKNRKKLEAKVWNLNGSNKKRAGKAVKRESELRRAKEAAKGEGEGVVVAIAVVVHEKGRRVSTMDRARLVGRELIIAEQRKKVLEIGWATWTKGTPMSEIAVEHVKIEEHLQIHNGEFVPDRRDGELFVAGSALGVDHCPSPQPSPTVLRKRSRSRKLATCSTTPLTLQQLVPSL